MVTVVCPVCDRPYLGETKKAAEEKANKHVMGNHPEYELNPFQSEED